MLSAWLVAGMFSYQHLQAQYVTIPDSNFVTWMRYYGYAPCLNGNQLDTTCSNILNAHYVYLSYFHVNNLDGIQYFKNLDSLKCNADTTLSSIPQLPPNLKVFECRNNALDSLPALPSTLQRFVCDFNQLKSLPPLPAGLQYFSCINNQLSALPVLPATLNTLYCSGNKLDSLPSGLPPSLVWLSCYSNKLVALPSLPNTLQQLACSKNQISSLPVLPNSLVNLDCYSNRLTAVPLLPASLTYLSCSHNQITSLPPLPAGLTGLSCEYNQLTNLPELPDSMSVLYCDNNPNLHCLPQLKRILDLEFYNTGVSCVPDYGTVDVSNPSLNSFPLCDSTNNTYGCLVINSISEISRLSFTVYPNPAKDIMMIKLEERLVGGSLQLTDLRGRRLVKMKVEATNLVLSVNNYPSGLYFIRVTDAEGRSYAAKVTIEQ
jgi:Leucine-rich repeat (LRR) protein